MISSLNSLPGYSSSFQQNPSRPVLEGGYASYCSAVAAAYYTIENVIATTGNAHYTAVVAPVQRA